MRHDSPQGERIGFWFHLAFAGMYALAFAWHIKGAREHARDMRRETPFEHLKRDADVFTHDVIRRHNPEAFADVQIGAYADYNPAVGRHIDHCVKTGENFFATRPTLEDLQEENRLERLNGKRSNRDI